MIALQNLLEWDANIKWFMKSDKTQILNLSNRTMWLYWDLALDGIDVFRSGIASVEPNMDRWVF